MPKYPEALLDRTPAAAVAAIGGTLLDAARTAWGRIDDPADDEALHDFRVALRRLRSVLRAFRPYVQHGVPRKLRRQLRNLARATNVARDTEVQVSWVRGHWKRLTRGQRVGARWFITRLEDELARAYEESRQAIEGSFPRLEQRVRRSLATAVKQPPDDATLSGTFAGAVRELLRDHLAALDRALAAIQAPQAESAVHAARISAKRLRYLLELVGGDVQPAARAVKRLTRLQTVLGELHDAQVLDAAFAAASESAAAEHARRLFERATQAATSEAASPSPRGRNALPGVLALAALGRDAQRHLFEEFTAKWRDGEWRALTRNVDAALAELATHGGPAPLGVEIERKYLLTDLPSAAREATSVEVDQGWLPGARLEERIRRVGKPDGDAYFRTLKSGVGVSRLEVEEETTAAVFETLWPLTEGRRVHKRRYYVEDRSLTWEIDEFLDRELVLAEVELPDAAITPELPAWLSSVLVREVTGEPEFLNVRLAR